MTQARILVVEDEAIIGMHIQVVLKRLGYTVVEIASSADEALQAVRKHNPDLVLMDIHLRGEQDGIDAALDIQQNFQTPVVYLTAHADPATLVRAKTTGPFGYVLKPFQEQNLFAAIEIGLYKHQLDMRLRESEARYRAVVEQIAEAIILVEPFYQNILEANRAFLQMFGYRQADVSNLKLADLLQNSETISLQGEAGFRRKNGEVFDGEVTSSRISFNEQEALCVVIRDITERKQLQAQVTAVHKMASLGTLAAGVAHEINTPLQVVTGLSSRLLNLLQATGDNVPVLSQNWVTNLEMLYRNAWRCAEIVHALQLFAEAAPKQFEPEDLNLIARSAQLVFRAQLKDDDSVTLSLCLAENLPPVMGDGNLLAQALLGLLTNAYEAMPDGGEITLSTSYDPQNHRASLNVCDQGVGIPDAILERIFDPFFTTKPVGLGSGLGLSVVQGIVQAHGGSIVVVSRVNQGSTFSLVFPEAGQVPAAAPAEGRFDS